MTDEQFDRLVTALEKKYQGRQAALARRSAFFAMLGYTGLAFFLVASIAIVVLVVAWIIYAPGGISIKLGLVIGLPAIVLTWAILRGLWVRMEAPTGVPVKPGDSPALFALIDSISREAGGVNFDQVLLTGDLNAAVVQVPRLGVFGWYKTYLLLGVPLMDAMAPEEFTSVLAHEFAHLSHQHGRLGSWLYRLRISWLKVMASLAEHGAPRPVLGFINWFWPRFNASAFVLSRVQEYQADAFAAKVTSPQSSALALQRLAVESRRLDDGFWDDIGRYTNDLPKPPEDVFHRMHAFLGTAPDPREECRWLEVAMAIKTGTADTHPGLKDRLAALGVAASPGIGGAPAARASDSFLSGPVAKAARDHFSREWHEGVGQQWELEHRDRRKLQELLEACPAPVTPAGRWQNTRIRARLFGPKVVQPEVIGMLTANSEHVPANFFRGVYLAEEDDPAAIAHLEKATERPDFFFPALNALAGLYQRLGREKEIPALQRRAETSNQRLERADYDRGNVSPTEMFLPAELQAEEQAQLLAALKRHPEIQGAWVVRKKTSDFPAWRGFVLLLDFPKKMSGDKSMEILREVLKEIFVDGHFLALLNGSDHARTATSIMGTEGSALLLQ